MSETGMITICPRCGAKCSNIKCSFCGENVIDTHITEIEYWDWKGPIEKRHALDEQLIDQYARNSGAFDEALFQKRKAKVAEANAERRRMNEEATTPKCPSCGSTSIHVVPRKWSVLTGFLTNKVDRVCVNCKHKW